MRSFEQEFPNFESYQEKEYYCKNIPSGMIDAMADIFIEYCYSINERNVVQTMKTVVNVMSVILGKASTSNWQKEILSTEIKSNLIILCEYEFSVFMDGFKIAAEKIYHNVQEENQKSFLQKLNKVIEECKFGYALSVSDENPPSLLWESRWKSYASLEALKSASFVLERGYPQVYEHIEQAKEHLQRNDEPRKRKNSVRDALSAMEALLKILSGKNEIQTAYRSLQQEQCWGPNQILKDGYNVWREIHHLYPDIRHGNATSTEIDLDEALYWISRISVYINYLGERAKSLGR